MKIIIHLLLFIPVLAIGQINVGPDQTKCYGDSAIVIASLAGGMTGASIGSPILITECDPGGPDVLEIQNVSPGSVDVTGWRIIVSASYTDINSSNPIEQVLTGTMLPGDIKSYSDASTAIPPTIYWGSNILWNPGAFPTFASWIILLDDNNNVMDVFIGNWPAANIANSSIVTSVGTISLAGHWNGNGVNQASIPTLSSSSRIGNEDNDDATDFTTMSTSANTTNANLSLPFPSGATWYDLNTGQIIGAGDTLIYSPQISTYIVGEVIDSLGQIWSDTMFLEILNPNISASGLSLCNGAVSLTAPNIFSSYSWSTGSSLSTISVNNPGSYFVTCSSLGISCQSEPVEIYQTIFPVNLSTPDSVFICQGDVVTINSPIGFSSYQWNTGASQPNISASSTGIYYLSVIDINGCTGLSDTTSINVYPSTITATTSAFSLCGGPVTLDAGTGPASFEWYKNSVVIPNETNQTLVVNTAGDYYVIVTYPTGCTAVSGILNIAPNSGQFFLTINSLGADSLCLPNGNVILDAGTDPNGLSYSNFQWGTNGAPIPGGTSQTLSVTMPGTYFVNVTDASGCQGVSNPPFDVLPVEVNTSAISEDTPPINQFTTDSYSVTPTIGSTYNWNIFPFSSGTISSGQGTNSIEVYWNSGGPVTISVLETNSDGCEGDLVELSSSIIISSINETYSERKLDKIINILGKEVKLSNNSTLFYIYDDGSVKKKIIID